MTTLADQTEDSPLRSLLRGQTGMLILLALVVICYGYSTQFGYIWDDDTYVQANQNLDDLNGLSRMWTHIGVTPQYYPITFTSFWIEVQIFGRNPVVSHAINFLLHAASVVLLLKILQGLRVPGAWLAAAIFAVHPINVESVAWISERKNTLSLAFGMASLLVYLRYAGLIEKAAPKPKPAEQDEEDEGGVDLSLPDDPKRLYGLFLILFVCALLSKTTLAVLPGVVLVIIWWKRGKLTGRDFAPMIAPIILAVIAGLLTSWIEQHPYIVGATGRDWDHTLLDRIALAGQVSWFYVGKLLLPHPFVWGLPEGVTMESPPWTVIAVPETLRSVLPWSFMFSYPKWALNAGQILQWAGTIGVIAVVGLLWLQRDRFGRGVVACVLIYLGCLVPAMGFANVYPMRYSWVADHFAYVASIGLIVMFAAGMTRLLQRVTWAPIAGAVLLGWLSIVSIVHSLSFSNVQRLWTDTLLRNNESWLAAANLGSFWKSQADKLIAEELPIADNRDAVQRAIVSQYRLSQKWLERAHRINPDAHEPVFQLAMIAFKQRDNDRALQLALQSEEITARQGVKQFIYPKLLMAAIFSQQGRNADARQIYLDLQSLEGKIGDKLPATFADARVSLAKMDEARMSAPIGPNLSEQDSQILGSVIENLTVAADLAPFKPNARNELARIMIELGRTDQAYEVLAEVLSIDKNNIDAKYLTAEAAIKDGNHQIAGAQLADLIRTRPDAYRARLMLSKVLVKLDRKPDAIRELETLLKMRPDYPGAAELLVELGGKVPATQSTQATQPAS